MVKKYGADEEYKQYNEYTGDDQDQMRAGPDESIGWTKERWRKLFDPDHGAVEIASKLRSAMKGSVTEGGFLKPSVAAKHLGADHPLAQKNSRQAEYDALKTHVLLYRWGYRAVQYESRHRYLDKYNYTADNALTALSDPNVLRHYNLDDVTLFDRRKEYNHPNPQPISD